MVMIWCIRAGQNSMLATHCSWASPHRISCRTSPAAQVMHSYQMTPNRWQKQRGGQTTKIPIRH